MSCSNAVTDSATTSRGASRDRESRVQSQFSTSFLLRDGEEEVFSSRFNFPRPPSRDKAESQSGSIADSMDFEFDFNASIFGSAFFESEIWPAADVLVSGSERGTPPIPHLDVYGVADHLDRLSNITFALSKYASPGGSAFSTSDTLATLQQVFSQARVVKHIDDYFRGWHRNCPVIHRPSFRIGEVDDVLLVGVILLGAMYSASQKERSMASTIMAYGEEFIFHAVSSISKGCPQNPKADDINEDFQIVQAGFCMVVVQFWTGDAEAKQRVFEVQHFKIGSCEIKEKNN